MSRVRSWFWRAAILLTGAAAGAGETDVVINEIHYHPFHAGADPSLEFVELHNLGGTDVDLGDWSFARGIQFVFRPGTILRAGEHLVVSPDPAAARSFFRLSRVEGPYAGQLSNDGETLELVNAHGKVISRVHYLEDGAWPALADGRGPSLEFTGSDSGNDQAQRWEASWFIGGTPGAVNSRRREPPSQAGTSTTSTALVPLTGNWATFRGRSEPSNPITRWTEASFDDAAWQRLPGGFGYGGQNNGFTIGTTITDMVLQYSTFYIRQTFTLDDGTLAAILAGEKTLRLSVSFNDAFVAYLNGVEIGRENVGSPGVPVAANGFAASTRTGTTTLGLAAFAGSLQSGNNAIALQGINRRIFSQDFYIGAELSLEDSGAPPPPPPAEERHRIDGIINEVLPGQGPGPGYLELYNPTAEELRLGGYHLHSSFGNLSAIPAGTVLAPGAFLTFSAAELGFELAAVDSAYALLEPDRATIVDVLQTPARAAGRSFGRFPDGDEDAFALAEPTPGAANLYTFVSPVVINEIQFHPAPVPPSGDCARRCSDVLQWIELYNRGAEEADIGGWSLTKGIEFRFPAGMRIPAGGFLVAAASAEAFRAAYPGVAAVAGDWSRRLSHGSDTINLRDALGNRVDHVKYGDGQPINDLAPEDGFDDRTFRGTAWPSGADGSGRTLELIHPFLDNRAGGAWRASAAAGGTPGAPNSALVESPAPVIDQVEHSPAVPRSTDPIRIACRIASVGPVTAAEARWSVDGGTGGTLALRDDGASGDGAEGDGLFAAVLPPQTAGAIIRFQVFAANAGGSILVPQAPAVPPYGAFQGPYYLFEVDNSRPLIDGAPVYRVIMTAADRQQLRQRPATSDVLLPATFIAGGIAGGIGGGEVRHLVGVRFRGESARNEANRSYRIEFHSERLFQGIEHLNLIGPNGGQFSSQNVNEFLAHDLFRRAGAPYPQEWQAVLRFPGEVNRAYDTRYIAKENFDDAFLARFFGGSDHGNFYRARNPTGPGGASGDLAYLGANPNPYRPLYEKRSNREEADWSDIIELTRAFDPAETPDAVFAGTLEGLIDAAQWAQFFAIESCLTNIDGGIWNNNGEDYFLYRVPADSSRADAGKWLILPWDNEETFQNSNERLFLTQVVSVSRFLRYPPFARLYYQALRDLAAGPFSRLEMIKRFGIVDAMYPPQDVYDVVDPLDAYVARRNGYLGENIPSRLQGGAVNSGTPGTPVIAIGDVWRFFRGRSDPPGAALEWTRLEYDDAAWEEGPTGIGYGDGDDATVLIDMLNGYLTVFARRRFSIADPAQVNGMTLTVDYDDAFAAYLNGVEVARSPNAPALVQFDQPSTSNREASAGAGGNPPQVIDITAARGGLVAGDNVLAIVGFNAGLNSSDFSLIPSLSILTGGEGPGLTAGVDGVLYAQGSRITLRGLADPVTTLSITAGGAPARVSTITAGNGPFGLSWEATVDLAPGDNRIAVRAYDGYGGLGAMVDEAEWLVKRVPNGFTAVSGTLAGATILSAAAGPYRLGGAVQVPAGSTLTIEPGAVVLGDPAASLIVRGRLVAEGTAENPIVFGAFDLTGRWGGIALAETGTGDGAPVHVLRFCEFRGGSPPQGFQGLLSPVNSRVIVEDCLFADIAANALDATDARLEVRRCRFERVREGIHCTNSVSIILDSVFARILGDSDAIDFDGGGPERSRIERCIFALGDDDGIDLAQVSVDIRDNIFYGIADKAISVEENGSSGPVVIAGNLVFASGTGMALKDGLRVEGDHNTVVACEIGMHFFAKDAGPDGGHGDFHSSIVWGNSLDVMVDSRSSAAFSFSNLGGRLWPGEGNISRDPDFMDPAAGDFFLRAGSPCIGAGKDGSDMGALSVPVPPVTLFVRGDSDESGAVDISDPIASLHYLFLDGPAPACRDRIDANDDGSLNISDPVYTLVHLFGGGSPPPPPYPDPGPDPTPDEVVCP